MIRGPSVKHVLMSGKLDVALIAVAIVLLGIVLYRRWGANGSTTPASQPDLQIASLIENVKAELVRADEETRSRKEAALFQIHGFDLELNFVVKTVQSQKGEVKAEFLAVGADTETSLEKVQKITLHMVPVKSENIAGPPPAPISDPHPIVHDPLPPKPVAGDKGQPRQ